MKPIITTEHDAVYTARRKVWSYDDIMAIWEKDSDELTPQLARRCKKLEADVEQLLKSIDDFLSYFDPRGGVSDVPLGPFERAKEMLSCREE